MALTPALSRKRARETDSVLERLVSKMNRSFLAVVSFVALGMAASAPAQNRETALSALAKLPAVERQARILDGAKRESGLVW